MPRHGSLRSARVPLLSRLSLGVLGMSILFDVLGQLTRSGTWAKAAFWNVVGGLGVGAASAALACLALRGRTFERRAARVGLTHALLDLGTLALFGVSLVLRAASPGAPPGPLPVLLSALGFVLALSAAYLSGELGAERALQRQLAALAPSASSRARSAPHSPGALAPALRVASAGRPAPAARCSAPTSSPAGA